MALGIKDSEPAETAIEIPVRMGGTTTALRMALHCRRLRVIASVEREEHWARVRRLLSEEIWPELKGKSRGRLTKPEKARLLGYGSVANLVN
ncbi:MAG: hypothetical protein ABI672_18680 [Vicinamibacteria bacterium]